LIGIALSPGTVEEPMFANQAELQNMLLAIAFICVPILLCAKPCILRSRMSKKKSRSSPLAISSETNFHKSPEFKEKMEFISRHEDEGEEDHDFGEIVIHQCIETIEFVLGMVSNTASYLRLWALSLAHTELAQVFWEKSMEMTINMGNPIFIIFGYGIFAGVTFGVLLMMDVLECFLHALRLHWVEFQNKFFKADGFKFTPFSFKRILEKSDR